MQTLKIFPVKENRGLIYEVIDNSYFAATKLFPTDFFYQCRNNPNNPQNITNTIKSDLENVYGTGVV